MTGGPRNMVCGKPYVCVASHRISSGGVLTTGCAFSVLQMELTSSLISGEVIFVFRVTFKMFAMYRKRSDWKEAGTRRKDCSRRM